jgi:hypothetical protein
MNTVWAWLISAKVCTLVRDVRTGQVADQSWQDNQGAALMVAEAISQACAGAGLRFPREDAKMLAVLARDGAPVSLDTMPHGAAVELTNGRLGLYVGAGVVESHGAALSLVHRDPARMVRAWLVPGLAYMERVGS